MRKQVLFFVCLFLSVLPVTLAQQPTDDALQALLDDYRAANSPAVVLYVWTPDATYAAVTGLTRLNRGNPATVDDRFRIGSVSKTYTAVAALQLVDEGLLDLDAPISTYLPADLITNIDGADAVTTRQLLNMSSGLYEYLQDDFYDAVDANPTYAWTPTEIMTGFVYGEAAYFAPGSDFEYTNTNYLLLQLIIESVTGQPLHAVVRANILEPIGADDTYTQIQEILPGAFVYGYEDLDGDGALENTFAINDGAGMGDGALVANAADVARFYESLFYERDLLEDETLTAMLTDTLDSEYGLGIQVFDDQDYGMIYGHSGSVLGFSSDALYLVEEEMIVVLLHADLRLDPDLLYEAVDLILGE